MVLNTVGLLLTSSFALKFQFSVVDLGLKILNGKFLNKQFRSSLACHSEQPYEILPHSALKGEGRGQGRLILRLLVS